MITLLNGEKWETPQLIEKMYDDDFYYEHLGKYALSSSSIKMLLKSPKTYKYVTKYGSSNNSQALRDGKLFHTMVLEPHKIDDLQFVDVASKNTNKYKFAKEQHGEVFTNKERQDAERLTDALLRNEAALQCLQNADYEVPAAAMIQGIAFRAKADILQGNTIIDVKTTQDLSTFRYSADKYGYDLQAYLYKEMFGVDNFIFLVIDKGSCDIGLFECSEDFYNKGKQKLNEGIENYKYFFATEGVDVDQYVMRGIL